VPHDKSGGGTAIVSRDNPLRGKTDWDALDRQSDDDIARSVASDADAVPIDIDWSEALLVTANKVPISIRIDPDVLAFFKDLGRGYQSRINQVLRTYVEHRRKRR
jgi:uncharacterized protein (DUF4415 family)